LYDALQSLAIGAAVAVTMSAAALIGANLWNRKQFHRSCDPIAVQVQHNRSRFNQCFRLALEWIPPALENRLNQLPSAIVSQHVIAEVHFL